MVIGLAFVCLWRYSNTVAPIRKVSTILCRSYQIETNEQLPERNDCAVPGFSGNLALEKIFMEGFSNMGVMTAKAALPACPVETTLTLIGDKWKVLILRDLMPGTKRFGELKKVRWQCVPKGLDRPAPGDGGERTGKPQGLRRSAAESGIFSDRTWQKPEAYSGFHVGNGARTTKSSKNWQMREMARIESRL